MLDESEKTYTAAAVIIGNEVLSGRIQDANLQFLAVTLKARGIRLREARVIADDPAAIIDTVNTLRARHDYVLTTGGIGPTHDDITAQCVADAFGVPLLRDPRAVKLLEDYYGERINEARLRMANVPQGADLLENPVSRAPGFQLGNVFVLPGVPSIMRAMVDGFKHRLAGGAPILSRTVGAAVAESVIAAGLEAVQNRYPELEIGSYPYVRANRFGTSLVLRGTDPTRLDAAAQEVAQLVSALGVEPDVYDGEAPPPNDL
jgi:molybdenum cofactor synthesis domain-containing protein